MIETLGFLGAFAGTVLAIPALVHFAPRLGLVDVAAGRKVHDGEIPLIGGIVMGLVFLCGYLAAALGGAQEVRFGLGAAIAIVLIGGMLDDLHELRSAAKFGFQIAAALVLVHLDGTVLVHLGQLLTQRIFTLGDWSVPLTVFAVVGVMNAVNMADGIDGLAGALALLAFVMLGTLALLIGESAVFVVCCLGAGVTAGFLCFNMRTPSRAKAAVFMGDTGSLFLGLMLAWCAIRLHNAQPPALNAVTAGWILGVILGDTLSVLIRRALRGRNPFAGDREHLHHLLLAAGLTIPQTVAAIAAMSVAAGIVAMAAEQNGVPAYVMFYLYLGLLGAYCAVAEVAFRRHGRRGLQLGR
jgi:UDP-GlcNAc:undecaprenyl-phosphate/decaprenyl-phosphate GlcNAc-1-phosphate transferase